MIRRGIPLSVVLGATVFFSLFVPVAILDPQVGIRSSGTINDGSPADITVYMSFDVLGTSNYRGTTQVNGWCINFLGDSVYRQTLIDGGFQAMREYSIMGYQPATSWNTQTQTGTWNWASFDSWLDLVNTLGAEPFITVDPLEVLGGNGNFPDPVSFGHYLADFVQHVYESSPIAGRQVYYDLINEAWMNVVASGNPTLLNNWFTAMKTAEADYPNLLTAGKFSSDIFKGGDRGGFVFEELLNDAWRNANTPTITNADIQKYVGWLSYHTTSGEAGVTSDDIFIRNAEYNEKTGFDGLHYEWGSTPTLSDLEKEQMWKNKFGATIPIFGTETKPITDLDIRNSRVVTAVWRAERTRAEILQGIVGGFVDLGDNDYSWKANSGDLNTGAYTLVVPNYQETWRYYTHVLINNNLSPGDTVYDAWTSNFQQLSALAWSHNGELKLLLVSKAERSGQPETLNIRLDIPNISSYTAQLLDPVDSQSVTASITQTSGTLSITLSGYAVALLTIFT